MAWIREGYRPTESVENPVPPRGGTGEVNPNMNIEQRIASIKVLQESHHDAIQDLRYRVETIQEGEAAFSEAIEAIEEQLAELRADLAIQNGTHNSPSNDDPYWATPKINPEPDPPIGMVCWVWYEGSERNKMLTHHIGDGVFATSYPLHIQTITPDHWRPANGPSDLGWAAFGSLPTLDHNRLAWTNKGDKAWVSSSDRVGDWISGSRRIVYIEGRGDQDNE